MKSLQFTDAMKAFVVQQARKERRSRSSVPRPGLTRIYLPLMPLLLWVWSRKVVEIKANSLLICGAVSSLVFLVACGAGADQSNSSNSSVNGTSGSATTQESVWVEVGKDTVRAKLRDPSSAEFRGVYFFQGRDGVPVACGEVNSNNGMGGKTGFQRFIAAGSTMAYMEEELSDGIDEVWNQFCK
jgi:hypothetical protein